MRRFNVVGVFEAGAQEYDFGLALVHMQDMQRMGRRTIESPACVYPPTRSMPGSRQDLTDQMKGGFPGARLVW